MSVCEVSRPRLLRPELHFHTSGERSEGGNRWRGRGIKHRKSDGKGRRQIRTVKERGNRNKVFKLGRDRGGRKERKDEAKEVKRRKADRETGIRTEGKGGF